jgi:hypothetical protein
MLTSPCHKGNANQNYTGVRFHFTPVGIATIMNTSNKYWQGFRVWWKEPLYTVGGNVISTTTMESSMEAPQKY